MTERYEVCPVEDLPSGERVIVDIDGKSIGIFNIDGDYYALNNICPHQMAPLCEGVITGTTISSGVGDYQFVRSGEILRCPWHGWEFDLATGESMFNPHKVRTMTFDVSVESTEDEKPLSKIKCPYGTELKGEEPPVDTYPVEVEKKMVVVYI